ncbi:MAG: hypothetical protein Q9176_000138 [Flavoplaca citrina]
MALVLKSAVQNLSLINSIDTPSSAEKASSLILTDPGLGGRLSPRYLYAIESLSFVHTETPAVDSAYRWEYPVGDWADQKDQKALDAIYSTLHCTLHPLSMPQQQQYDNCERTPTTITLEPIRDSVYLRPTAVTTQYTINHPTTRPLVEDTLIKSNIRVPTRWLCKLSGLQLKR